MQLESNTLLPGVIILIILINKIQQNLIDVCTRDAMTVISYITIIVIEAFHEKSDYVVYLIITIIVPNFYITFNHIITTYKVH